jgi:hypothetical protein
MAFTSVTAPYFVSILLLWILLSMSLF